jgi:hypothetical protein
MLHSLSRHVPLLLWLCHSKIAHRAILCLMLWKAFEISSISLCPWWTTRRSKFLPHLYPVSAMIWVVIEASNLVSSYALNEFANISCDAEKESPFIRFVRICFLFVRSFLLLSCVPIKPAVCSYLSPSGFASNEHTIFPLDSNLLSFEKVYSTLQSLLGIAPIAGKIVGPCSDSVWIVRS